LAVDVEAWPGGPHDFLFFELVDSFINTSDYTNAKNPVVYAWQAFHM